MPAVQPAQQIAAIARRWHDLAERRLDYYAELYRSGRWTLYYRNGDEFAERMRDVIKVAKTFRALAGQQETAAQDDLRSAA